MNPLIARRSSISEERSTAPVLNVSNNIDIGEMENIQIDSVVTNEVPFESPEGIDKAAVTSMKAEDFGNCTAIGELAFYGYNNLETIELPNSVTKIKQFAFASLPKLKSVIIPDGEIEIDGYAFFDCKNLKSVRLPEGLKDIKQGTFSNCKKLSRIRVPDSVTKIEDFAFWGCSKYFKATNVSQDAKMSSRAFPKGKKSYSLKKTKSSRCCFKVKKGSGIGIVHNVLQNEQDVNDLYNDVLGANINNLERTEEPVPVIGQTQVAAEPETAKDPVHVVEPERMEEPAHVAVDLVPVEELDTAAEPETAKELDVTNTLERLLLQANYNQIGLVNENQVNEFDNNTRVETDKNLLNRLKGIYMLNALNISTAYIYNQSGLTEKFRLYDGNRSEITIEKENGIERIKHNVDKGNGSSNMMRILYPSSAGTLAIEGGYEEAFKRDCAPSVELMGEIVAHLYKYREDKQTSIRDKIESQDIDSQVLRSISAYISAKDEENPETGEITKGADQIRNEIRVDLAGDRSKNESILNRIEKIFKNKPKSVAALGDISMPDDIRSIKDDGNRDDETKYNDIMGLIEKKEALLKERVMTKKQFADYGKIKGKLEMKVESADIEAIERALGFGVDRNVVKEGRKFSEPINAYKDKVAADKKKEEKFVKASTLSKSLMAEFPSLRCVTKESLPTFVALIRNAETMIDQESDNENGDNEKVLPKYTTERMFMTYVLDKFGKASKLNKFYDKVEAVIPEKGREYANKSFYEEIARDRLEQTRQTFEKYTVNENSPYKKEAFKYSTSKLFRLTEKDGSIDAQTESGFPDCADTAARHFINLLSYDGKENGWNYIYDEKNEEEVKKLEVISNKVLEAINGNKKITYDNDLGDRVKAFYYYQNKRGIENTDDLAGHTFWNYVISNMNEVHERNDAYYNIKYNRGNNELLPGYINFLKLAYNIAYSLKAGKALKTAKNTAYDGKEGQLAKAKNAINALDDNYDGDINRLKPLLKTALEEVFSLYNKEIESADFVALRKGGYNGSKDIVGDNEDSEFKISRIQNADDSLDFGLMMHDSHAETHHNPCKSELTEDEKRDSWKNNPQLMLLPNMEADRHDRKNLSLFDRLFTSSPREVAKEEVENSSFCDKLALQNMIDIVGDEGIINNIGVERVLKKLGDNEKINGQIKANIIDNNKAKNGHSTIDFSEYVKEKFIDTVSKSDMLIKELLRVSDYVKDQETKGMKDIVEKIYKRSNLSIVKDKKDNVEYYCAFSITGDSATLIGCERGIKDLEIPATVELNGTRYSVMSIREGAFKDCSSLTSITIPNSMTRIGHSAFRDCRSLTSVTIPNSVMDIGRGAFKSCSSLTSVTIPNSVTDIGKEAFKSCSSLTSVIIPNSVTEIGEYTFYGCSSLTSVTIPNSVTEIGNSVFYGCSSLTSVIIPNSVTEMGGGAFSGCSSLTSVIIPNSVTRIGDSSFNSCKSLTNIEIPNSVTEIGRYTFYGCSSLTSLTIQNGVKMIGEGAFTCCSKLESATIPNSVTEIGSSAFSGCSSLTSVTIPNSVTKIECYTFLNCSRLQTIELPEELAERETLKRAAINLDKYSQEALGNGRVRLTRRTNT